MRKLLLTLTTATLLSCAPAHAQQIDDWHYSESVDAMTDEDTSIAYTAGEKRNTALAVRCTDGESEIVLFNGAFIGNESRYDVTYRVGIEPAKTVEALTYGGGTSVKLPNELISEIAPGNSIVFRLYDFRGVDHTHSFSLIGYMDSTGLLSCVE